MSHSNLLVIGISGVTCGGKTTTASEINKIFPGSKIFSQDDYFWPVNDPRHVWIPELNHINFDILSSLDMEGMYNDVRRYIGSNKTSKTRKHTINYLNGTDCDLRKQCFEKTKDVRIVIVEGFCIFNYRPLTEVFDLKYYFTLDRDECYRRRVQRVYEPPDCPGYFERCAWVEHLKQLEEVQETVENVVYFNEKNKNPVDTILRDILNIL
ncbi:nicotinamide riboside kinase 1 [Cylas formicarius]|uniref:nicotinamide riboside kinase 1 n=1 Tax=Cylas formicarius TaxID=197179 RepID=UPI0029583683|nr:nicotinamide riboside kinase 1 [Cylas formicarius]